MAARPKSAPAHSKTLTALVASCSPMCHTSCHSAAAIRGYVETGYAGSRLDEATRRRYLGIVFEETERLEHIGDLLDLAKLEGGGATIKHEEVSLAQLFAVSDAGTNRCSAIETSASAPSWRRHLKRDRRRQSPGASAAESRRQRRPPHPIRGRSRLVEAYEEKAPHGRLAVEDSGPASRRNIWSASSIAFTRQTTPVPA
jgi:hypothetical protein